MRLTKDAIERVELPEPGHQDRFLRDNEVRGLGLRITCHGTKTFIFEARVKGRVRRLKIGQWPDWTVLDARKQAQDLRARISHGEDPSAERAALREEPTFGELATTYMERHATPRKRSASEDEALLRRYIPRTWSGRRLSDFTTDDVSRLHDKVGKANGRYSANRLLALLRTMFNKARDPWKLTKADNPAIGIEPFAEQKRERYLTNDEIVQLNQALMSEPDWRWRAFFPLSLMFGTRRSELLSARWTNFDLAAHTWLIPQTKSDKPLLLPVPTAASAILETLPSRGKSEFVFPGVGKTGHIVEPKKAWKRIKERAGVEGARVHDLRHTLGGRLASAGVSLPLIGRALNHSQPSTTSRYAHVALEPVRAVLEANALAMTQGADETSSASIPPRE
jgi:integrase